MGTNLVSALLRNMNDERKENERLKEEIERKSAEIIALKSEIEELKEEEE